MAFSGTCLGLFLLDEDAGGKRGGASSGKPQTPNIDTGANDAPPVSKPPSYMKVVMMPGILNLGASYFFIKLARYTLMFWLPFYLAKEHGYGAAEAAYISTLFDFGGVAGSLACGALSDRVFGGKRLLVAGPMCVFTGMLLLAYPGFAGEGIRTNCVFLFLIGFNVAGPDSVLGGASTTDVCENNGMLAVLTTACGTCGRDALVGHFDPPLCTHTHTREGERDGRDGRRETDPHTETPTQRPPHRDPHTETPTQRPTHPHREARRTRDRADPVAAGTACPMSLPDVPASFARSWVIRMLNRVCHIRLYVRISRSRDHQRARLDRQHAARPDLGDRGRVARLARPLQAPRLALRHRRAHARPAHP